MIVIANNAEIKLRHDLQQSLKLKPNQRCFYLEFSKRDLPKARLFETFLRTLEEMPNSYMARIYLCRDKDILIFLEGFMQDQFLSFIKTLSDELNETDLTEIIDILEIGKHWERLQRIYTRKIEALNQEEEVVEEQTRKKIAKQKTLQAFLQVDPALASTIAERRKQRDNPLVMVADDEMLCRTLAGNALGGQYELSFAKTGTEAIHEYVATAPDILFLDIGMPDIDGQEVLESLFQVDPQAYIIMFSGRKDKATIMDSLERGAQGFLGKPFTAEELHNHAQNSPFLQAKRSSAA